MTDVDVPADTPLRRPTAAARRGLCWAQILLGAVVLLTAYAVGGAVQERIDAREAAHSDVNHTAGRPLSAALVETVLPAPAGEPVRADPAGAVHHHGSTDAATVGDGALAALGTLIVGATFTAAAGTVGRRWLDDREAARWDADWARVEPVWSGRLC